MPKMVTPAMERYMAKQERELKKSKNGEIKESLWKDVARRLFRNKMAVFGLVIIIILLLFALFPRIIAPYGFDDQDYMNKFVPPNAKHIMGTDNFGRDIFSRVVYGARISMLIGFASTTMAVMSGGLLGALAAFYGGRADNIIMRFMDILLAIPNILLSISIVAALGPGLRNTMIAISIGSIPTYARVVRASVLTVKEQEFVEAARAIGAEDLRLIFRHMLPNAMAPIIVQATLGTAGAILSAAGLSFIGLGIQPPTPEWGGMLSAGRQYIRNAWYVVTFPGIMIMITVFALNLLGDGLRDALDPRMKR